MTTSKGFATQDIGGSTQAQQLRSYRIGINTRIVGKTSPDQLSYAGAFKPKTLTLRELAEHCGSKGHPWMPSLLDKGARRYQQFANHAELLALDIDGGMTIEQAKQHSYIAAHCGLAIETASSTPGLNKFRAVFPLHPSQPPLSDWRTIKICTLFLQHLIQVADKACKDASRFYFGATGREAFILNESASLPESFVSDAISWHSEQERIAEEQYNEARRKAEERRSQYGEPSAREQFSLIEQALACVPPRTPGSGNYEDWMRILAALVHELGEADAIALVERYSPSIKGSTWNVARKARSFSRGAARPATLGSVFYVAKQYGFRFPETERKTYQRGQGFTDSKQTSHPDQKERDRQRKQEWREETDRIHGELNGLSIEPTIRTKTPKYIPKGVLSLPEKGGIIVVNAWMGSGKSQSVLAPLVEQHRNLYPKSPRISIVPRNILGRNLGETLGLPHHEDGATDLDITACWESSAKLKIGEKTLILFDEASQTFSQLLSGSTYRDHSAALGRFRDMVRKVHQSGGWIVLSEEGLTNVEIDLIREAASGIEVVEFLDHEWDQVDSPRRKITVFDEPVKGSPSVATWGRIEDSLAFGDNTIAFSDSQKWLRRLERKLAELGYSVWNDEAEYSPDETFEGREIWIIDSTSSHQSWVKDFCLNPDRWIQKHKPRFLGCSPTVSSGVSIRDDEGHFSDRAFHFTHLSPRNCKQQLERLRTDVPSFGYIKKCGHSDDETFSSCRPDVVMRDLFRNKDGMTKILNFVEEIEKCGSISNKYGDETTPLAALRRLQNEIEIPGSDYAFWLRQYSKYEAQENYGKLHLREKLIDGWIEKGFDVEIKPNTAIDENERDLGAELTGQIVRIREDLEAEESNAWADIHRYLVKLESEEIDLDAVAQASGEKEALNLARLCLSMTSGSNPKTRRIARKYLMRHRLPTCDLDNANFICKAIVQNGGKFLKATELFWLSQNREAAKQKDIWSWIGAFTGAAKSDSVVPLWKLSTRASQAKLVAECPLQPFIDGKVGKFHNDTAEAIAVHEWALLHHRQIKRYLRLKIDESHTVVTTVNKLLKKIGFDVQDEWTKGEEGGRGKRKRIYFVANREDADRDEIMNSLTMRFAADLAEREKQSEPKHDESTVIDTIQILRDGIEADCLEYCLPVFKSLSERDRAEVWKRLTNLERGIIHRHHAGVAA